MPGSIKIDDGSGNYTILTNAGSLGSDKTLTIPNETGTLNLQSGSVLQVVNATDVSTDNGSSQYGRQTTETSFQDTGLTATITPSATSSKILVLVNHQALTYAPGDIPFGNYQLVRGSTAINTASAGAKFDAHEGDSNAYVTTPIIFNYLDSPSTTSATTYKTQNKYAGSGSGYTWSGYYGLSSMTLIEIGG